MNVICESEKHIICVLDALDECQESSRKTIIAKLSNFYGKIESDKDRKLVLKFLMTNRPYANIERNFKKLIDISFIIRLNGEDESESIRYEIDHVIRFKVKELRKIKSIDEDTLITNLSGFENRTYLWLYLVFTEIENALVIKKHQVPKTIAEMPKTVDQAYTKILNKSHDPTTARKLLHIILAAGTLLSLEEVNVAMNIDDECDSVDRLRLNLYPANECQSTIKNMCGLFLSVVDSRVYLIHQTAREFLLHKDITVPPPRQTLSLGDWKESFDIACSNLTMARICIAYILLEDF